VPYLTGGTVTILIDHPAQHRSKRTIKDVEMKTTRFGRHRFIRYFAAVATVLIATTLIATPAQAAYVGTGLFESIARPNQCLDSNGTDVYLNPCDPGNVWQRWVVNTTGARPNGYDEVTIRHANSDSRYLTQYYVQNLVGNVGGLKVAVHAWNSAARLYFDGAGRGWYDVALQSLNSDTNWARGCVDAAHPGWNFGCYSTNDQRWKFRY
jgi:hypothetical protein